MSIFCAVHHTVCSSPSILYFISFLSDSFPETLSYGGLASGTGLLLPSLPGALFSLDKDLFQHGGIYYSPVFCLGFVRYELDLYFEARVDIYPV